jgi:hypothetical protein
MSVEKELLKDGITELYIRNKISEDLKTEIDTYIDDLSMYNLYELKYSEFNKTDSENVTFSDTARTATLESGTALLLTNEIALANIKLKSLKL